MLVVNGLNVGGISVVLCALGGGTQQYYHIAFNVDISRILGVRGVGVWMGLERMEICIVEFFGRCGHDNASY